MSANGSEESRPSREIAYRLFAAEFDDASFSYSESDEERAPNYVVTPTGARVNRMFAVGVLTEVEPVNDDVLRGRIVDPTGAFVSYAGQYQPDEMAFLDRASPPAFVALSGKARTFQPDDSDRVFTSVRPESMSRVDADTRDRWTVTTAEATLHRVGVMAAALQSGLSGGALRDALLDAGVDEALSKGVPLAIDHYGTTPAYLAALRRLALDALEVVANDRDSVRSLDREPSDAGESVDIGTLAADLDLSAPAESEATAAPPTAEPDAETAAADSADAVTAEVNTTAEPDPLTAQDSGTDEGESIPEFDEEPAAEPTADAGEAVSKEEPSTAPDTSAASAASTESTPDRTVAEGDSPARPSEADASEDAASETTAAEAAATDAASETTASAETTESADSTTSADTPSTESAASAEDDLGDFDAADSGPAEDDLGDFDADDSGPAEDDLGDFETGDSASASETANDVTDESATTPEPDADADLDDDGMYQLDEDERAEIEAEFGTEFATGSEVAPAGEADIDVPSVEELEAEADDELAEADDREPSESAATSEPVTDTTSTSGGEPETEPAGAEAETDDADTAADDAAADVDLETVAVEAMDALDDGDGASREAVVAHVVDEYGADPEAVEDAIQSALMSGQCYEPTEDSLKAI